MPDPHDPLDIERPGQLLDYLRRTGRIDPAETPRVARLAGGVSNRTMLVERATGEAWVLKQALHKLRVEVDWFSDPARIGREAAGLRHLATLAPPGTIAPLVFEDPARHLLAMRAVPRPHENWKAMLMAGRVEADHVRQFARLLLAIHQNAKARDDAGDGELRGAFDDRTFFESLRVEPYYAYTASAVPAAAGFYEALIAETRANRSTLVHGDYSPKNVLVHRGRLILLDHEVIHWGDPAFDLGFALAHLLSKAHHFPPLRARFAREAARFAETYGGGPTGDGGLPIPGLQGRWVRHALGCLLARVAGRSPLEYLGPAERARQRDAVLGLMADPPAAVPELVEAFTSAVKTTH